MVNGDGAEAWKAARVAPRACSFQFRSASEGDGEGDNEAQHGSGGRVAG
jgi:hypothetical protein